MLDFGLIGFWLMVFEISFYNLGLENGMRGEFWIWGIKTELVDSLIFEGFC